MDAQRKKILDSLCKTAESLKATIRTLEQTTHMILVMDDKPENNEPPMSSNNAHVLSSIQTIIEDCDSWIDNPKDPASAIRTFLSCYRAIEAAGHSMDSIMGWLKKEVEK